MISSWTVEDYETTCRQMGFGGGRYVQWMDRVNSSTSRPLLLENPRCRPGASSLFQCDWNSRRVGAGVCGNQQIRFSPIQLPIVFTFHPACFFPFFFTRYKRNGCQVCFRSQPGCSFMLKRVVNSWKRFVIPSDLKADFLIEIRTIQSLHTPIELW